MAEGLLGIKRGTTQIFEENGQVVGVTVIEAGPCFVTQIKTPQNDGYSAIQLGFGEVQPKKLNRPLKGTLGLLASDGKKTRRVLHKPVPPLRHLHEIRTAELDKYQLGQKLNVAMFAVGERVDVTGTSKGKGTAGVVKRHHFSGGSKTHGQSDRWRRPGASGATTSPGRVLKGTRRAGHLGAVRRTVSGLKVVLVDPERNLLAVAGSVPGAKDRLVVVKKARKQTK
jgi:large subunit ribosomal protein L3